MLPTNAEARWVDRPVNPVRAAAIHRYAGSSFLDVGCGNGQYVRKFRPNFDCHGVDISEYPQWGSMRDRFHLGDAGKLPFAPGSFESIVSFETLEHVHNPSLVLREFHRVCSRNVILSVPNCELPPALESSRLTFYHYIDRTHVNFFTMKSLEGALSEAGFRVEALELFNPCAIRHLLESVFNVPAAILNMLLRFADLDKYNMTILAVASRV